MWSPKPTNPGAGADRLPLVGPGPRQKDATGGARPLIVRDEFRAGYSLIGLLASSARLRFTDIPIIKHWTKRPGGIIIER